MPQKPQGPSLAFMLMVLAIALLIALLIAHRLIAPFFRH
jgi:hypothetical protein